jgi:hypothetical protein
MDNSPWGHGTAVMLSQPPFFYLVSAEKGKLNRVAAVLCLTTGGSKHWE